MESSEHSAQFVDKYRSDLIQRVTMVMPIAEDLLSQNMIHEEVYSNISAARTNQGKMRELFTALHSGGNKVKSAFLSMLREHEPNLVQDLEFHIKQGDQRENKSTISLNYKEFIRGEYATVQEYNSLPGEHVKLDDRYTEPLIIQKHRQQREREEEIRSRGQNFYQVMDQRDSETYKSTKVERLFDPDEHGDIQRTVILQGNTGTGKSFTTQKIMSDWAFGRLYEDRFDFVFHLRCRELNKATGNKSVIDLLNYNQSSSSMIKHVLCQSPERVLFLVDGFDELKFSLDVPKDSLPRDPWTQCSPEVTLSGLIRRQILPESFMLVTTRSTAMEKLKVVKHPVRYAEILGFSEEGVKVYFEKFFKQKQHSHQAYDSVRKNETLFTACFIPVICWIICTVYREQFDEGTEMIQSLETTTSIFVEFVDTLLKHHCQDLGQSALTILQGLGKLAEKGMEEQQVLFDHDSVSQTVSDPSKVPFLCKFLQKKRVSQTTMYSFMHLSFQEFFTALSYMLLGDEEAQGKVRELLSKVRRGPYPFHLLPFHLLPFHLLPFHLLPIVQFLFGILNKDVVKRLEEKHISCSQGIWTQLKHFILEVIEKGKVDQIVRRTMQLFTFHCLYELHADDFVKEAMDTYTDINMSGSPLKKTDCWVLMYCLQHCKSIECLELSGCNLTAENMKILLPALQKCKALVLSENNFSDEKVQDLLVALTKHKPRNVEIGVKSITSNTADKFMFLISKAHADLDLIKLHSCGNVFLSGQLQKDGVLSVQLQKDGVRAPQIVLWIKVPEMKMICDSIRTSGYRLTGVKLRVSRWADKYAFPYPTDNWRLTFHIDGPLRCGVGPEGLQPALISVELSLYGDVVFDWRRINQLRQTLQHKPEWDEHADELISLLHSQTILEGIYLLVSSLTERCAASVVSLSQACFNLKDIILQVNGFLLEEGIQCLRESKRRPDNQLLLLGRRCRKLADQCSEEKDKRLSCNDNVLLALHGESFIEIVLRHGNESGIDDTWNGNESDSDGTGNGNESDSDGTGNGNESDSDGTGNGNENDSDGTGNGKESNRPRDDIKCKGCCVVG
ncbi:NACHT, LRR and PYD domains-containing protein 1 homolog isoform X2 [Salvelinus namaycush]|uniref:NACHT, LRR and PYD domains-containing protein 1 homolog isoform X2 n=1 Tax=Salvelinus namaycush TaxID=8040 RepID=A0A8U1EUP0_SALNM|nr:NACHT, LRR and PYD domains-containing protein 1 homolog isoform X2 [Salvelinus namaycush]